MRSDESSSYPIHIFYSYAQEDVLLVNELEKHLSTLMWQGYIIAWDKRNISAGTESSSAISINLNTADIILLMVSADFIASDYCYGKEMLRALERHIEGTARVVPIILRPVDWEDTPFSKLQALPSNGLSVSECALQDVAFKDIAQEIRKVVKELQARLPKERSPQERPDPQGNGTEMLPSAFKSEPVLPDDDGDPIYPTPILVPPRPTFDPQWLKELDGSGGAVTLDSQFYVERQVDTEAKKQLLHIGTTIRIQGSRQTGKTSLLARLSQHATKHHYRYTYIDLHELDESNFSSLDTFLSCIASHIAAKQPKTKQRQEYYWEEEQITDSKAKLTDFLSEEVLKDPEEVLKDREEVLKDPEKSLPFIIFLDEVDLLSARAWKSDFLSLIRSWHNNRARPDRKVWKNLNIVLTYSNDDFFLSTDLNQSPFNVGTHFRLADFNRTEVEQLNYKHGSPVKTAEEMDRIMRLLQGHPFLVCTALYTLVVQHRTVEELLKVACDEDGPFSEHLRHYLLQLDKNQELRRAMKSVIQNRTCPSDSLFYQLRSSGLVVGPSRRQAQPRCELYRQYLQRHL